MISSSSKIKSELLEFFQVDKYQLTLEKITEGRYKGHYVIRSYKLKLWGLRLCSLAAWQVQSDEKKNTIKTYSFKPFRMLNQAIDYAKYIKHHKYPNWINYQ